MAKTSVHCGGSGPVLKRAEVKLKIVTHAQISKEVWAAYVNQCPEAWFCHLSETIRALALWPGKKDVSFAVTNLEDEILALVPLHVVTRKFSPFFDINRLESTGGPAFSSNLTPKQRREVNALIMDHLVTLHGEYRVWESNISISAMTPAHIGEKCPRVNPLLELGFENRSTQTWVVDLRKTGEEILRSYSETTRNEIRRLLKSEHCIREASGSNDLDIYYNLHRETYRRTGATPHPRSYFEAIFNEFIPKKLSRILFFEKERKVIAAQNSCFFKGGASYWTGASRSEKSGGETKLLCHTQILHAKTLGCDFYDVGEAFPQRRSGKAKGLSDFKRSLGGALYPIFRGNLKSENKPRQFVTALYDVFRTVREA